MIPDYFLADINISFCQQYLVMGMFFFYQTNDCFTGMSKNINDLGQLARSMSYKNKQKFRMDSSEIILCLKQTIFFFKTKGRIICDKKIAMTKCKPFYRAYTLSKLYLVLNQKLCKSSDIIRKRCSYNIYNRCIYVVH